MSKYYMESMVQDFNNESTAKQFVGIMTKYLNAEQVEIDGSKVTCHAKRKSESWFMTLFTMYVVMGRKGLPVPQEVMMAMTNLAVDFNDDDKANEVEKLFKAVGLDQKMIMMELKRL